MTHPKIMPCLCCGLTLSVLDHIIRDRVMARIAPHYSPRRSVAVYQLAQAERRDANIFIGARA